MAGTTTRSGNVLVPLHDAFAYATAALVGAKHSGSDGCARVHASSRLAALVWILELPTPILTETGLLASAPNVSPRTPATAAARTTIEGDG